MTDKSYLFRPPGEEGGKWEDNDHAAAGKSGAEAQEQEEEKAPAPGVSEAAETPKSAGPPEAFEIPEEDLSDELLRLQQENEELKNRLVRLQADFENYRKRVRAEKEELVEYANCELIKKILPVIDNMERACSASQQGAEGLIEGLEMITKQLREILEKEGLEPIECQGKPFDPPCHEAVMQEESPDHPPGTVIEELQKGYRMKDRVLRPSMVKVSGS